MNFAEDMVAVCEPSASSWRERLVRLSFSRSAHAKILSGSLIMLFGSIFVSLANFGYNIGVARLLGPADFSHAAAAVTILMLMSAITLAFQLVCTKLVAKSESVEAQAAVFQFLHKRSWWVGIALGAAMLASSSVLASY